MKLNDINENNRTDNITVGEDELISWDLHGFCLYVHNLFENRWQEAQENIEQRRTGTIVSHLSRDHHVDVDSIGSSIDESFEDPLLRPAIIIPLHNTIEKPMVVALGSLNLENLIVQRAWNRRAKWLNNYLKVKRIEKLPEDIVSPSVNLLQDMNHLWQQVVHELKRGMLSVVRETESRRILYIGVERVKCCL